jgi:hypothetical protein
VLAVGLVGGRAAHAEEELVVELVRGGGEVVRAGEDKAAALAVVARVDEEELVSRSSNS